MLRFIRSLLGVLLAVSALHAANDPESRVVIVANRNDPDSVRIAQHYATARGIPLENIFALPLPQTETISWPEFVHTLWEPLQEALIQAHWINAIPMRLADELGRTKIAPSGHRISYLVTCRGVPLRIMHDPALFAATPRPVDNPLFTTNAGAVDSELALLAGANYAINAYLLNPLYGDDHPTDETLGRVIKVSRLDGPTASDAMALVDHALEAEKHGLLGRAYVDLGGKDPDGDRWLEAVAQQLTALHFDVEAERTSKTFAPAARFDAPVLYFGWYAGAINGPFTLPGFRFPPGAIALHIHSYSAETLRSADARWCGPLIARGVTATVGNVFEPYLQLTHRPDLLLKALARGDCWGDAAAYALPAVSWQAIAVGDPLYRPFAVPLATQWKMRQAAASAYCGYADVRKLIEADAEGQGAAGLATAWSMQHQRPSLELGVALAQRALRQGDRTAAARAIAVAGNSGEWRADQWALVREAAELLCEAREPNAAENLLRALFEVRELPDALRSAWLPDAVACAQAAGDAAQAEAWRQQLGEGATMMGVGP